MDQSDIDKHGVQLHRVFADSRVILTTNPGTNGGASMTRIALMAMLIGVLGCGPTKEEKANASALTPLIHRSRALSDGFDTWFINNEIPQHVSWETAFGEYEKTIAAQESLLAQVRQIVPTPRYDCVIGLTMRSIQADIDVLTARESYLQQSLKVGTASQEVRDALASARASEDDADGYLAEAKTDLVSEQQALAQADTFKASANSDAIRAAKIGDTLVRVVLADHLLPSMAYPGYPIVTDSGPDSLYFSRDASMPTPCDGH